MIRRIGVLIRATALCVAMVLATTNPAAAQSCSFSISDVDFGSVDLTSGSAFTTTASLNVTCAGPRAQTVIVCPNINAGGGGVSVSGDPRTMRKGPDRLQYNLYSDPSHTNVWGSYVWGLPPTPPVLSIPAGSGTYNGIVTIYGRINPGQTTLPSGNYVSNFNGPNTAIEYAYFTGQGCNNLANSTTVKAPFTVTATNTISCSVTATNLDFGTAGVLAANVDTTNTITVTCASGIPYTVGLDGGLSGATDPTQRLMRLGSASVAYGIYRDAARTLPWGSSIGTNTIAGNGNGNPQNYTGYGRVGPQATPAPGTYNDTIVVTVTY